MQNSISKIAVVVLVMIAFVGQAYADLTASCDMHTHNSDHHMTSQVSNSDDITESNLTHAHHSMPMTEHPISKQSVNEQSSPASHESAATHEFGMTQDLVLNHGEMSHGECCQADCFCPASACSSVGIVNSVLNASNIIYINSSIGAQSSSLTSTVPSSLYRPPIAA